MIGSPAHKKCEDDGSNNLKRATGLAGQCRACSEAVDYDSIAGDDDAEGDNKAQEEAGNGHGLVAEKYQLLDRLIFIVLRQSKVVKAVDYFLIFM